MLNHVNLNKNDFLLMYLNYYFNNKNKNTAILNKMDEGKYENDKTAQNIFIFDPAGKKHNEKNAEY